MKSLIALALIAGATLAATAPADAAQGCGPRGHRGPHGRCIGNDGFRGGDYRGGGYRGDGYRGGGNRGGTTLVIGTFYHGRGYWDGRGYRQNRYRDHGGAYRYR